MDDLSLVDSIYESAFVPEMWPGVLDRLAHGAGCLGGFLFTDNGSKLNWTASAALHRGLTHLFDGNPQMKSQRQVRLIGARHAGFLTEHDIYSEEEQSLDPLYRDFMWPRGMGHAAGTAVDMPTGDVFVLSLERERSKGPVSAEAIHKLDSLRPHIARSAFMAARQGLIRARATSDALAMIGLPAIVMNASGKVLVANDLIENLKTHLVWRRADRFAFRDRGANAILQQAIETIDTADNRPVRSFAVKSDGDEAAMIAHVLPLCGSARDIFVRCAAVLVLTPVTMPQAPPIELVQSLFDLTPAEARVARGIAAGETVEEIATGGGVSSHTVRTQMRGVLGKTGCRRQAEVAALLSGINVPRGV